MKKRILCLLVTTLMASLWLGCVPQQEKPPQTAEQFFASNTVTLVSAHGAGGGTDYGARLLASYWKEATGGTMVVENKPGSGGILAANYVNAAKPDGLTVLITELGANVVGPQIFGSPGVEYDMAKLQYLVWFAAEEYGLTLSPKVTHNSLDDLKKMEGVKFGGIDPGGNPSLGAALVGEALKLKNAKTVTGYGGTAETGLALGRGEVDAYVINVSAIKSLIDRGFAKPPLAIVDENRSELFPDVPTLKEVAQLSKNDEVLLKVFSTIKAGKLMAAPPGTPQDRVEYLRAKVEEILAKAPFVQQAKLMWPLWTKPIPGQAVAGVVASIATIPAEEIARFRELSVAYTRR